MKKLLYLLITLILTIYVICCTQLGLRWFVVAAECFTPGLIIEQVQGQLDSTIRLENIWYTTQSSYIHLGKLHLKWSLWTSLKSMKLQIEQILIDNLLILKTNQQLTENKNNVDIKNSLKQLKYFNINRLLIRHIQLISQQPPILISEIILNKSSQQDPYQVKIQLPEGIIFGKMKLDFSSNLIWSANLVGQNITILPTQFISKFNFHLITNANINDDSQTLMFKLPMNGLWKHYQIKSSIDVVMKNKKIMVNLFSLRVGNNFLTINGIISALDPKLDVNLNIVDAHEIWSQIAGNFIFKGNITDNISSPSIQGTFAAQHFKFKNITIPKLKGELFVNLAKKNGQLLMVSDNLHFPKFHLGEIRINLLSQYQDSQLSNYFYIKNKQEKLIQGSIIYRHPSTFQESFIKGKMRLDITDLNKYIKFNKINQLRGDMHGLFTLNGPLQKPNLIGNIVSTGQFFLKPLALNIKNIKLNAKLEQNNLHIAALFSSGKGAAKINSTIKLNAIYPIVVQITGRDLQIANSSQYQITSSPNLNLVIEPNIFRMVGKIELPYVKVIADQYHQALEMPAETIILDDQQSNQTTLLKDLAISLQLTLGNDILIIYKDLRANLSGSLTINKLIGGLTTANGTLHIKNGLYKIYNKLFNIDHGRLIYLGNIISNPGLDIKALKKMNTYQTYGKAAEEEEDIDYVGAYVQGTLDHPRITLISNPPMSQDEILSQLIFGNSLANIGDNSLSMIGGIASNLNLMNPNLSDTNNASPRFQFDLFNPLQAFNLKYHLSKHWLFLTRTTFQETSGDLLYTYEH